MNELFIKALLHLKTYKDDISLSQLQRQLLEEVIARLENAAEICPEIIRRNNFLLECGPGMKELEEIRKPENVLKNLKEEAKTNPELEEWLKKNGEILNLVQSVKASSYDMIKLDAIEYSIAKKIKDLHSDTERFYENLWLIIGKLSRLPRFKKFKPEGVRDVRNHLIVHSDSSQSGALIYSFGVATRGPELRPLKPSGVKAPNDKGLQTNVEEFLNEIIKR